MHRFSQLALSAATLLMLAAPPHAHAAELTPAERAAAIDDVLRCVSEHYIYPDLARKMEQAVRERVARKEYDAIKDGAALAEKLTRDLRAVSWDRHLGVGYSADVLPPETTGEVAPPPGWHDRLRRENFGLSKVEVLPGNVGYLDFRYFAPPEIAGDTYVAAMNTIANTDALILDLRRCTGSLSPDALPMLCSYFFERATHLNDIYWRGSDTTRQYWTAATVSGKKYLNKPIYVLTSGKTFSGAEELAYDLQSLHRAILVGETTGGGANPGGDRRASDHFTVWVPTGRVINPVTKTNWEGVGVAPDVRVPAAGALHAAHVAALKQLTGTVGATDAAWKTELNNALASREQSAPRFRTVTFTLQGHTDAQQVTVPGSFNFWAERATPLTRRGDAWVGQAEVEPGRHAYKFLVDGRWIADPANPPRAMDNDAYSNSTLIVE